MCCELINLLPGNVLLKVCSLSFHVISELLKFSSNIMRVPRINVLLRSKSFSNLSYEKNDRQL